jgi:succinyl-diaminopimelate desuccinylase
MIDEKLAKWVDAHTDEMVDSLVRLVNIRSVSDEEHGTPDAPYGEGCRKVLAEGSRLAQSMGFTTFNHENY